MSRAPAAPLRERIVDAALAAADDEGWERIRLRRIAEGLGVELRRVRSEFADLDAVADAWLSRADDAMLAATGDGKPAARLERALLAWFQALAGRRRTLRAILVYKLTPSHPHLQAALAIATSRRVQWLREAARLDAAGIQKQMEEIGLTALFVSATTRWLFDREDGSATRRHIRRRLALAEAVLGGAVRRR